MKKLLLAIAMVVFLCITCYYDNEENLYPALSNACDTANVTFSSTVSVIMDNHCLSCHSNATAANFGNNIRLEDYTDVKTRNQSILGSIKHESGFSPMPKSSAKLDDCLIRQFEIWVKNGSPEN